MPTYDYKCDDCGYGFELFQGMMEKKLTTCPKCQGSVRRLIGAGAGVVFKGSGFYETDYRSSDYRRRTKEDSKGSESGAAGAAEKAEAKPEAPAAKKVDPKPAD
jgi:putative FmdB family regulatory protein